MFCQRNAFPWIAALLRDLENHTEYVNSWCSAVLVGACLPNQIHDLFNDEHIQTFKHTLAQIGNRFAVTAAHCLYDESKEEVLASSLLFVDQF